MYGLRKLLCLPPPLLLLAIHALPAASEKPWPYNLAPHEKYFPEHEVHIKRELQVKEKLARGVPAAIRKMSEDEGEMFFLDYWQFGDESAEQVMAAEPILRETDPTSNTSTSIPYEPPYLLHSEEPNDATSFFRFLPREIFQKRDFQCPTGTHNCSNVGQANICCDNTLTCVTIPDSGLGTVGCCPNGQKCSGGASTCNTAQGYTSCPGSSNGGCCIPGFTCQDVGCVASGRSTTTTTVPATTVYASSPYTVSPSSSASTTVIPAPASTTSASCNGCSTPSPTPSSSACGGCSTPTPSTPSTSAAPSTVIAASTLTCSPGFNSCPASQGGGCCPTDRACGSPTCPPLSSTLASASTTTSGGVAPGVRPTSASVSSGSVVTSVITSSSTIDVCPTGYYRCSAYFAAGCCRVGRDCSSTSCPASDSTSVLASNSVTIIVGSVGSGSTGTVIVAATSTTTLGAGSTTAAAAAGSQGSCASGWFSCGADAGGGCCPSGYNCGASCTPTAAGVATVGKQSPSSASAGVSVDGRVWWLVYTLFGVGAGMGMILL